jgi:glycosyltransferase involved in cell wall biosynthesis
MPAPAMLIGLPCGLGLGGVTTFAVRLANGLAARGRPAAVLLHREPADSPRLDVAWHPAVRVLRPAIPPFEAGQGEFARFIPHYRDAVRQLAAETGRPVIVAPQMHGDGFGVGAALCLTDPEWVRLVGWQNSDIEYDTRVLAHFEPVIARFIAVSDRIEASLRARLPGRAADILNIPYGVEIGDEPLPRAGRGPLRLIYTGRLEHHQKRALAIVHMSDELSLRGVPHRLTVVGDGPAGDEFRPHRREHDALVLPSRYEGLSVSMLEAMAAGCVPILARTESGARQAVESGYNGEVAEVAYEADDRTAGLAMAEAVARFVSRDRGAMATAATQTVRDRFSLDRHLDAVAEMLDSAAASPPLPWPADRPCAFTASAGGAASGSVPADGAARLRDLLDSLAEREIVIHGTGQHTLQLAVVLAASPARIVAFTDDDRQRHGTRLWNWPIIAPQAAGRTGATDLVISSWMHQDAIWGRRAVYESQGLRVHRVYPA